MKVKKTKYGYSFKGENKEDYDLLGKLVVEMSKKPKEGNKSENKSKE